MHVLISGAGVAGPALAYWLRRGGAAVTVVERAPGLRTGGHAVDFRGDVHLSVLRRMGVLEEVERHRTGMGAMHYVNERGRRISTLPADLFAGDIEILRSDLGRILHDATAPLGVAYRFGDTVTALHEDPDGVTVAFERAPAERFDLVIGADGLHSRVRALAFGPEEQYVRHLGLHCAIFPVPGELGPPNSALAYRTASKVVIVGRSDRSGPAWAQLFFPTPDGAEGADPQRMIREAFRGVGWVTPRLLQALDGNDLYVDSVAQVRMPAWHTGRVALLGDAGYSPCLLSGMGSGLAVVGAYVLAGELLRSGGDHAAGFAAYERLMRPYAEGAQRGAEGNARMMVPQGRVATALLNQYMRLVPYLPGKQMIANAARRTAEAVRLPAYA
ncbi:FAD-dependent monooxygenase [Dactylosporangium sp. NPDC049140]|uniref:FAD-dependent monooxygenase n=1 Tax=Dactylosporangium sp. NPDC049140 TaxID=3155647 RepID=UPI00340F781E